MRDSPNSTAAQVGTPSAVGPLLVTVEAGQILCLSRSAVYRLIDTGDLEVVHIGRAVRVPRSALVTFVDRLRTAAEPVSVAVA